MSSGDLGKSSALRDNKTTRAPFILYRDPLKRLERDWGIMFFDLLRIICLSGLP